MFGSTNRPKAQRGKPIRAVQINAPDRLLEQFSRLRGGRGTFWTPFGPQIAQPGIVFRVGITGSGGIPGSTGTAPGPVTLGWSGGIADCQIVVSAPGKAILSTSAATFDAYNLSSQNVAGQAITIYAFMWQIWVCVWEDCPQSAS